MASIFGHALTALALGKAFSKEITTPKFWILGIVCAIVPDADVISFAFGIPYENFWGHRGFSHSILFAVCLAFVITFIFYRKQLVQKEGILLILYFFLCTVSHGILDALTTGGLGIAFFSPFENTRYFLPWRPIKVSPIGASNFFSSWGLKVIKSELLWIGVPAAVFVIMISLFRRKNKNKN